MLEHLERLGAAVCAWDIENGLVWDVVVALFTLFLLELKGNAVHGALLQTDHEASGVTNDLVPETLGGDLGDLSLREDLFVVDKQSAELGIVRLDDLTRCALDRFVTDLGHYGRGKKCYM